MGLLDYLLAMDTLVNFEYRLEKLMSFSRRSIVYIHEQWGFPKPYNVGVFGLLSFLMIAIFKKILGGLFGGKTSYKSQTANYRFNFPDVSELGVIVNQVKKLQEDIKDIKGALAIKGSDIVSQKKDDGMEEIKS